MCHFSGKSVFFIFWSIKNFRTLFRTWTLLGIWLWFKSLIIISPSWYVPEHLFKIIKQLICFFSLYCITRSIWLFKTFFSFSFWTSDQSLEELLVPPLDPPHPKMFKTKNVKHHKKSQKNFLAYRRLIGPREMISEHRLRWMITTSRYRPESKIMLPLRIWW